MLRKLRCRDTCYVHFLSDIEVPLLYMKLQNTTLKIHIYVSYVYMYGFQAAIGISYNSISDN